MGSFVTAIIERPRHFYALNTPKTSTSSTPKKSEEPLIADLVDADAVQIGK